MAGNSDSTDKRDDDQGISPAEFQKDTTEMEPTPPSPGSSNHAELLDHAREFLASPAVRTQSGADKRRFLLEKGLSPASADALLPENQSVPPPVPPRTYLPPPTPSSLPGLLTTLAQAVGTLSAISGVGLWIYHSSVYPRLSDSFAARHGLRTHQSELAKTLTHQLLELKQHTSGLRNAEAPEPIEQETKNEDPLLDHTETKEQSGPLDFETLPRQIDALTQAVHESDASSSGFISLSTTSSRALESLTNLNAYITSETFNIPSVSSFRLQSAQNANSRALGPAEEEVRRELRALKGLVLNRRSFVPPTVRNNT